MSGTSKLLSKIRCGSNYLDLHSFQKTHSGLSGTIQVWFLLAGNLLEHYADVTSIQVYLITFCGEVLYK